MKNTATLWRPNIDRAGTKLSQMKYALDGIWEGGVRFDGAIGMAASVQDACRRAHCAMEKS